MNTRGSTPVDQGGALSYKEARRQGGRDTKGAARLVTARPQLYVHGEIECGAVGSTGFCQMYCSYSFNFQRSSWWLLAGDEAGDTFFSDSNYSTGLCVWNQPFEAHFAALSLEGWPRLEFVVRGKDYHGRNQLAGYGCTLIPPKPGTHELVVQCWRPQMDGDWISRWKQRLLGIVPELVDDDATHRLVSESNRSRSGMRIEDSVEVLVRLNVVLQEFESNNLLV